jgi:hypothetical protein
MPGSAGPNTSATAAAPAALARRLDPRRPARAARAARRAARRQPGPRRQGQPGPVLTAAAAAALALIALLVAGSTAVSLAESYRGLYDWAASHGYGRGLWAAVFPVMVDVFVVTGELAAFVSLALAWPARSRFAAYALTAAGLAVSVAGNVAHLAPGVPWTWRAGSAIPPLAAATALFVGLGVLKRIGDAEDRFTVRRHRAGPAPAAARRPARHRPAAPGPGRPVPPAPAGAEAAALAYVWQLRDAGLPVPSMRELARGRLASPGSPEGNKRAAARVLARLAAGERPAPAALPVLNHHRDRETEPAR